jgi:uncharacterized protein (DUF58 family)
VNLTPGAMLALALAALVGVLALWSDSLLADFSWRALVALVAVGVFYELYVTRELDVAASLRERSPLKLGRAERLELQLENNTRRNLAVELAVTFPDGVRGDPAARRLVIAPQATALEPIDAHAVTLGEKPWPALPVRVKGPLGLAWWSRSLPITSRIVVHPDTLGPREAQVGSSDLGTIAQATLGGGQELHHLREYRSGDPRRAIDWKASARTSRLITRVFSEDQHLTVMVLVDAGRTSRTEIDGMQQLSHYVNLAARFAEYCVASDDEVGVIVFADAPIVTLGPGRGSAAVIRTRRALTNLSPRPVESNVLTAALHVRKLVRHRCLAVILTDLYEPSAASPLAQSVRLLVPQHLPLVVGLLSEEVIELAARRAREWLDPYRAFAARDYRRGIGANVARLGRLGAYAMTARPSELDAKVLDTYRQLRGRHRI